MAISAAERNDLYLGLVEMIGPERAETLMSLLNFDDPGTPAGPGVDLVSQDIFRRDFTADLRADIAELRVAVSRLESELTKALAATNQTMNRGMVLLLIAILLGMVFVNYLP